MNKAKPMSEAPKFGCQFLAYDPISEMFGVMWWDEQSRRWDTEADCGMGLCFSPERATKWWDLPEVGPRWPGRE